jgi:hypothetical protein
VSIASLALLLPFLILADSRELKKKEEDAEEVEEKQKKQSELPVVCSADAKARHLVCLLLPLLQAQKPLACVKKGEATRRETTIA